MKSPDYNTRLSLLTTIRELQKFIAPKQHRKPPIFFEGKKLPN